MYDADLLKTIEVDLKKTIECVNQLNHLVSYKLEKNNLTEDIFQK